MPDNLEPGEARIKIVVDKSRKLTIIRFEGEDSEGEDWSFDFSFDYQETLDFASNLEDAAKRISGGVN